MYGHKYSNAYLNEICQPTAEGVSMLGISEAAELLGLDVVCGYLSVEALTHSKLPCILHWDQSHFVVLYKVKKGEFYIADPGKGLIRYSMDELKKYWINIKHDEVENGVALLLEPGMQFEQINAIDNKEDNNTKKAFRFL